MLRNIINNTSFFKSQNNPFFVVSLNYIEPLTKVNKYLNEHRAYLDKNYKQGNFIASGAKKPRTGGIILVSISNKTQLEKILNEDPFKQNKIATYTIEEFETSKYSKEFKPIAQADQAKTEEVNMIKPKY